MAEKWQLYIYDLFKIGGGLKSTGFCIMIYKYRVGDKIIVDNVC